MNGDERAFALQEEMTAWRRDIHRHPETAFEENRTADIVAEKLEAFGIEVHRGLAGTGVVGTIEGRRGGGRSIGLRADMDALHLQELNDFDHRSQHDGKMHACGHDGHTAMLLGAARILADDADFAGRLHLIFQPAEENEGGAGVMIEQGLFDKFPVDAVFGMHNYPALPEGHFAIAPGPMMASYDIFEITVTGKGTHGGLPQFGIDPVVTAAQVTLGLQTIASRISDPVDSVVVSITQVHGGDTWNVIPEAVVLRGTVRALQPQARDQVEPLMRRIVDGICAGAGATATVRYERRYPPLVNHDAPTDVAISVARGLAGDDKVDPACKAIMASEDFAFMLEARPGAYILIGNGETAPVHNPYYDFNDDILPIGVSYWLGIVKSLMAGDGARPS